MMPSPSILTFCIVVVYDDWKDFFLDLMNIYIYIHALSNNFFLYEFMYELLFERNCCCLRTLMNVTKHHEHVKKKKKKRKDQQAHPNIEMIR